MHVFAIFQIIVLGHWAREFISNGAPVMCPLVIVEQLLVHGAVQWTRYGTDRARDSG